MVFTCRRTLHAWLAYCWQIGRMRLKGDADGGVYMHKSKPGRARWKKTKDKTKKKSPLRCLAVCKLQLNLTNRHTERWIKVRDTKVLAVHMS